MTGPNLEANVRAEIARLDTEIAALEQARSTLTGVLNSNSSGTTERRPRRRRRKTGGARPSNAIAPEKVDAVETYVRNTYPYGQEFTSKDLGGVEFENKPPSTHGINRALALLNERGAIQLVRVGKDDAPRMKVWKTLSPRPS